VLMPRKHQIRMGGVKVPPKWLQLRMKGVPFKHTAAEERMVAVSENASVGVFGEVLVQPLLLR
jgi:hypothetical protein